MLYGLDLFSGIGGNTLGLRDYIKTIAYCEADRHAQSVLLSRMGDGSIEPAPIWDDIETLGSSQFDVPIDIIVGGFPCQDISVAGRGEGIMEGNRSGLFYEIVRLAKEIKPTFLFLENVSAIRTRGLDTVVQELTEVGYDLRWTMLSAADVGAPHKRERWFLLGYSSCGRRGQSGERQMEQPRGAKTICTSEALANSNNNGRLHEPQRVGRKQNQIQSRSDGAKGIYTGDGTDVNRETRNTSLSDQWLSEPNVGRVVDGVSLRVDRIKRLGNAVVPAQARAAFEKLIFQK